MVFSSCDCPRLSRMELKAYVLALLFSSQFMETACLTCYSCHDVTSLTQCNTTVTCADREVCFQEKTASSGTTFRLGCHRNQLCGGSSSTGVNLIGRSNPHHYKRQANTVCNECCANDQCNKDLCVDRRPTGCVDDPSLDCAKLSSVIDICADVDHAKVVCPNFCGLCNVVDGAWSSWSVWSQCDVTCGVGTMSRGRTCSDPAPANGGSDCAGQNTYTQQCIKPTCPVHGGWSLWSPWGECSVTCDVGLQRRDRTCSNPYPDNGGDHCYGDGRDDRICQQQSCADGGWSAWQQWGSCSASCGGGLKKRSRDCNNPSPSLYGRACIGNAIDVDSCINAPCQDGGWSAWQQWGTCSVSCGSGLKKRSRDCNNPSPSLYGRACIGNVIDVDMCIKPPCQGIAFNARNATSAPNDVIIFSNVLLNEGSGYNATSGYFTAPVAGLYQFSATVCHIRGSENYFYIEKVSNGVSEHVGSAYSMDASHVACPSANAVVSLKVHDQIAVLLKHNPFSSIYQNTEIQCSFGGSKVAN